MTMQLPMALLLVAGGAFMSSIPIPVLTPQLQGNDNTYWWCEMHHAPRNIQVHSISSLLRDTLWGVNRPADWAKPSWASPKDILDADKLKGVLDGSVRTPVLARGRLMNQTRLGDPHQSTFWCEMHSTGGDNVGQTRSQQHGLEEAFGSGHLTSGKEATLGKPATHPEALVTTKVLQRAGEGAVNAKGASNVGGKDATGESSSSAAPWLHALTSEQDGLQLKTMQQDRLKGAFGGGPLAGEAANSGGV